MDHIKIKVLQAGETIAEGPVKVQMGKVVTFEVPAPSPPAEVKPPPEVTQVQVEPKGSSVSVVLVGAYTTLGLAVVGLGVGAAYAGLLKGTLDDELDARKAPPRDSMRIGQLRDQAVREAWTRLIAFSAAGVFAAVSGTLFAVELLGDKGVPAEARLSLSASVTGLTLSGVF